MNSERLEAALQAHRGVAMKLVPPTPPGRSTRKARAFALQMRELRAQGYTFESIRQALAAVGVQVSNATVQRELARVTPPRAAALPSAVAGLIWASAAPASGPPLSH